MHLKEWAAATGISYATARRRYESGTLPVPTYRLGRLIMMGEPVTGAVTDAERVVVYARVSSADQTADLDRQVARVTTWATVQRLTVSRVVTEVGRHSTGTARSSSPCCATRRWRPSRSSTGTGSPVWCQVR